MRGLGTLIVPGSSLYYVVRYQQNRQRDELGYERMLKLRRDFDRALSLLEMVRRRERVKRELVNLSKDIFEKRFELDDWDERVFATEEELLAEQLASVDSTPSQVRVQMACLLCCPVPGGGHACGKLFGS